MAAYVARKRTFNYLDPQDSGRGQNQVVVYAQNEQEAAEKGALELNTTIDKIEVTPVQ